MSKIYTRTGDDGRTFCAVLGGRVDKDHPFIEAVGTLDELNSILGVARSMLVSEGHSKHAETLARIQRELFLLGYSMLGKTTPPNAEWLEALIDELMRSVELHWFILPYGGMAASMLHYARTVCRRFERRLVSAIKEGLPLDKGALAYVNRLGDALYAMAVRLAWEERKIEEAPSTKGEEASH